MESERAARRSWLHGSVLPEPQQEGARARRGEAGETLIEVLISVVLTGLLVVAVIAGVFTSIKASVIERRAATSEVVLRNFSAALTDTPYIACATKDDYQDPPTFKPVDGYVLTVDSVVGWDRDSKPATFSPFEPDCVSSGTDTGLQRVGYSVKITVGAESQVRRLTVLKRFNGTIDDLDQPVPAGGVRCTLAADSDTYVDEAAPNVSAGHDVTMDLVGMPVGQRRQALVHFNLNPDQGTCLNGAKVPERMSVRSVALRLYTWQVSGVPDCATACKHALRRVTDPWTEDGTIWTNRPAEISSPTANFSHGTGTGDYTARYQTITSNTLNSDVSQFYNQGSSNFGWSVERNCGPTNAGCVSPSPGFRMRTREWSDVRQRPTLTVVFAPVDAPGRQLRNIAYGTCVSIENSDYSNGHGLVGLGCGGRRDQLWIHPGAESGSGADQFVESLSNFCIENGTPTAGTQAFIWSCNGGQHQKWDFDDIGDVGPADPTGPFLKNRKDPTKCLAASNGKAGAPTVVQTCNGSLAQQWVYESPPTFIPTPDVRLTALKADGSPTNDCADFDLYMGSTSISGNRWAQTYPCLGGSRGSQAFNMSPDGRLVSRAYPGFCLGFDKKIVAVESCARGGGQLWAYEGTQIRNVRDDKCITQFGGRRWLELQPCDNRAGQSWALDPADTSPPLATVVQFRNNKYGDCVEPDSGLTKSDGGLDETRTIRAWTRTCGALDRPQQAFVVLATNELSFLSQPGMCLTSGGMGGDLTAAACSRLSYDNFTPNNPQQQWVLSASNQLQRPGTSSCAEGSGNLQSAKLKSCLTTGDLSAQQWTRQDPGTASTDLRQMRNVGYSTSCADLVGGANGTAISWPCSGADRASQGVLLAKIGDQYEIRSASNPNQCLDVQSGGDSGDPVKAVSCNFSTYQRWTLSSGGQLKTLSPGGRCLEAGQDNASLAMKDCTTNAMQAWVFEVPQDSRQLRQIRSTNSQVCLDVLGSVQQGAVFSGFPCVGQGRPTQVFVQLNNGAYALAASSSNLCIDAGNSNGSDVLLWGCKNPVGSHQWTTMGTRFKQVAFSRCAQFNTNSTTAAVQPCTTPPASGPDPQAWAVEAVGTVAPSQPLQFRSANPAADRITGCLDIDGATRSGYANNDQIKILPCLGPGRTNQSFRLMSNGLIRSSGTETECVDAASSASVKRPVLYSCDASKDDQHWKIDNGRIMNVDKNGNSRNRCIQGGLDGVQATMEPCLNLTDPNGAEQQWFAEDLGLNLRGGAVGRLRTDQADLCLETSAQQGSNPVTMWGWPCISGRSQQRFVRLNSGQYRPVDNVGFCVDANGGALGSVPRTNPCTQPTDPASVGQRWTVDPSKGWLRTSLSSTLCLGARGAGLTVRWQTCSVDGSGNANDVNQQWAFVPEAGL